MEDAVQKTASSLRCVSFFCNHTPLETVKIKYDSCRELNIQKIVVYPYIKY